MRSPGVKPPLSHNPSWMWGPSSSRSWAEQFRSSGEVQWGALSEPSRTGEGQELGLKSFSCCKFHLLSLPWQKWEVPYAVPGREKSHQPFPLFSVSMRTDHIHFWGISVPLQITKQSHKFSFRSPWSLWPDGAEQLLPPALPYLWSVSGQEIHFLIAALHLITGWK